MWDSTGPLVLAHAKTAAESIQPVREPRVESVDVELVRFANLDENRVVVMGLH